MFMIDLAENYAALWIAIQYGFENAENAKCDLTFIENIANKYGFTIYEDFKVKGF